MQEQGKHMKKIDVELFFTIDEKNNSIQLTDKGIDLVSGDEERDFFKDQDKMRNISHIRYFSCVRNSSWCDRRIDTHCSELHRRRAKC